MRKAFNFYKSYYDVYKEIESDKEKLQFIEALLLRQFEGIKPYDLKGMAKFAYISQKEVIDQQIKGWETKTGNKLSTPTEGGSTTPPQQVQEEGKGEVQLSIAEQLSENTEFKNSTQKHYSINEKEYLKQLNIFLITNDDGREFGEIRKHFFHWLKKQDLKITRRIEEHWNKGLPTGL